MDEYQPFASVPDHVAYFEVFAPRREGRTTADISREVVAYLYRGDVTGPTYDADTDRLVYTVRVEARGDRGSLERRVQSQRDRYASGLFGTSDPVFLGRAEV